MTDKLCLHLFGVPQFSVQDEPVVGLAAKKTCALLVYLAVTGRPHSRDALANLLWADKPRTARQNLKKAISTLRKNPLIPLIEQSDRLLRLDSQQLWMDITHFEAAANDAPNQTIDQLQQAIALYIDDFLAGFNISISLGFEA